MAPARQRVSRGTLSRDHIVGATLSLVRAAPTEPITMERVAASLGTRPMSLYTHVRNRDELLALAAERALREWDATVPADASWEEQLRAWCGSLREHLGAYTPLLFEITGQGSFQPALLEKVAVLSRALRAAGLHGAALAEALRWIPQTVLGAVVLELARPEGLRTVHQEAAAIHSALRALDDAERSELEDVLPHFSNPELADLFGYTVDRIVDGVRAVAS